jgi:hypothetical protein
LPDLPTQASDLIAKQRRLDADNLASKTLERLSVHVHGDRPEPLLDRNVRLG